MIKIGKKVKLVGWAETHNIKPYYVNYTNGSYYNPRELKLGDVLTVYDIQSEVGFKKVFIQEIQGWYIPDYCLKSLDEDRILTEIEWLDRVRDNFRM
jgi:hypothetical protein